VGFTKRRGRGGALAIIFLPAIFVGLGLLAAGAAIALFAAAMAFIRAVATSFVVPGASLLLTNNRIQFSDAFMSSWKGLGAGIAALTLSTAQRFTINLRQPLLRTPPFLRMLTFWSSGSPNTPGWISGRRLQLERWQRR
jgi:hypothetical protein